MSREEKKQLNIIPWFWAWSYVKLTNSPARSKQGPVGKPRLNQSVIQIQKTCHLYCDSLVVQKTN